MVWLLLLPIPLSVSVCTRLVEQVEEHMRDHALDEHESLKLFTSDLEGMKIEDPAFDDKMHQLMEVCAGRVHACGHVHTFFRRAVSHTHALAAGRSSGSSKSQQVSGVLLQVGREGVQVTIRGGVVKSAV